MKRILVVAALALLVAVPVVAQTAAPAAPPPPRAGRSGRPDRSAQPRALRRLQLAEAEPDAVRREGVRGRLRVPADEGSAGRSAQLLAHVANTQFTYCAAAKGEPNPNKDDFEKTATTKAAIQKALADSFAFCDTIYGSLTDAKAMEMVKVGQNEIPRAARLISNIAHDNEHYGNLVTYMRIKGIVPPSTERAQQMRK